MRFFKRLLGIDEDDRMTAHVEWEENRAQAPAPVIAPAPLMVPVVLSEEEKALIRDEKLINAIKEVRDRTGIGLKEAKAAVDAYRAEL